MKDSGKQQVNFADCYVLTNKRTRAFITSFLETFLPDRLEIAKTYEIPQFSEYPYFTFQSDGELITYLEQNKNEKHAVYWQNKKEAKLRGAMCIFTSDGQIILGLYCETLKPDTAVEDRYLYSLLEFCNSTNGLIEYEQPAPQDTDEFLKRIKARTHNRSFTK